MKLRFINTFEPVSSFYRDLLPYLAERGVEIEVLISSAKYRMGRGNLEDLLKHDRIHIHYVPAGNINLRNRVSKVWIMFSYAIGAALHMLFQPGKYRNFFLSQPPLFPIWGYILKIIRRQPYFCLIMDLYPDVIFMDGLLSPFSLFSRFVYKISRFVLNRADSVIVIGRCMSEYLCDNGVQHNNLNVITNWADEDNMFSVPRKSNNLIDQLDLGDDFIVLYSGNMGRSHYFFDLIEVARRLKNYKDIKFIFIGDGARRKEIEQGKLRHSLDNILLLPTYPDDRLAFTLSMGDLHFVCLRPGFDGLLVPSKAYAAMAVGRPILYQGDKRGEVARMVAEEGVGTVVEPHDIDALERAILRYYREPMLVTEQGRKGSQLIRKRFSRQKALSQYYSLLLSETA